jgi:predicted O-methyltransferase YrrM
MSESNIEEAPFSPFDRAALAQLVGLVARRGCRVAEVGSWMGLGSTQTFLSSLAQVPDSTLICVDTWQGAASCDHDRSMADQHDIFGIFRKNAVAAESRTRVVPVMSDSAAAAALMRDRSFDLVFIDADHSYDCVKADIAAWLPKVRPGGILCGHDCESRVTPQDKEFLAAARHRDAVEVVKRNFLHFHAGVILAVDETFTGAASLFAESPIQLPDHTSGRSSIWHITVPDGPLQKFQRTIRAAFGLKPTRVNRPVAVPRLSPQIAGGPKSPLLMGIIGNYNIVCYKDKFIGLPRSLGAVDLAQCDLNDLPAGVYSFDSFNELQDELSKAEAPPAA